MRFPSIVRFGRLDLVAAALASAAFACSTPAVLDGSTRTDASSDGAAADRVTNADVPTTGDGAPADSAVTDVPAAMDVPASSDVPTATDVPAAMDVPMSLDAPTPTDAPATTDVPMRTDVPTMIDAGGACTLPLGGSCDRGMTCPAGDGCNTCLCPLAGDPVCTRRSCMDGGSTDAPTPSDGAANECRADSDCRLHASYCASAPCQCFALSPTDMTPRCSGGMVTCFIDPCRGRTASCVGGSCVVTP